MATLHQIQAALQAAVTDATGMVVVNSQPVTVKAAIGWPPMKALQSIPLQFKAGTPLSLISIYDRKTGRNVTRWSPYEISQSIVPATLTAEMSAASLAPRGSATITLGGAVTLGDAVSAVLTKVGAGASWSGAQVALSAPNDTPETMATKLAAQITADRVLSGWVSAVAVGPVVTLDSWVDDAIRLSSNTGNGGSVLSEVGRREKQLQIACWTPTEGIREAVTDPIAAMIALAEVEFGFTLSDGTPVRLNYENDYYLEDDTSADVYRRDFLVRVDYPVTNVDALYSVLAPIAEFEAAYPN